MSFQKYYLESICFFVLFITLLAVTPLGKPPTANGDGYEDTPTDFNQTVNWKPPPNTRGTYSIISSCVLTWALCMWSAIHLNIPSRRWAKWQWVEKSTWLIWGMVIPEAIAYQALKQNLLASELSQSVRNILRSQNGSSLSPHVPRHPAQSIKRGWRSWFNFRRSKPADIETNGLQSLPSLPPTKEMEWTLTHGFHTLMGGLALETDLCDEQFLPRAVTRMALTVEGIKFLATHAPEIIPHLPPLSEIKDKSKANSTSKVFACMQVVWFCLQCLERSFRHLPITLFEITTMSHYVYAIIIHFLWWGKPFSVEEPTTRVVGGEKMSAIMSYMWMSSAISCPDQLIEGGPPEFESMRFCADMVNREALPETVSFCHHSHSPINAGSCLEGNGTGLSHSRPTICTNATTNSSPNNAEPGYSDAISNLEGSNAHVMPVSDFIRSQQLNLDDPTICRCCGISRSMSQDGQINTQGEIPPSRTRDGVSLYPGQYLSITGFCLCPESGRFKWYDFPGPTLQELEKKIYLDRSGINRWSLASLAITKYGLPVPSVKDLDYVRLQISHFPCKKTLPEHQEQILWKIALFNGLGSMMYVAAWNYSFSNGKGRNFLRGCILFSCVPLVFSGTLYLSRALYSRFPVLKHFDFIIRGFFFLKFDDVLGSTVAQWLALMCVMYCTLLYLAAKHLVVLFAVHDLFYLPDEAYQVAIWTNNFPHIF